MSLGDFSTVSAIENELDSGERLLWKGRPRPGIRLRGSDVMLIPFSLLWAGFALFWEYMAVVKIPKNDPVGWLFPLFGVPFVLFGIYIVVGRFFLDAKLRDSTEYALTNRRAIIVTNLFGRKIRSVNLQTSPEISFTETADRNGTITFGSAPYYGWGMQRNLWFPGMGSQPAFEMIDDVRSVYDMIESAKRD
jgi:hypothetical protein